MKLALAAGTTSQIVHVFIQDSSVATGAGKTALVFGDITAYYVRAGGTLTALTMETIATLGTWASTGDNYLGFKLLHDVNAPGLYELHLPNNILAAGSSQVTIQLRATGAAPCLLEIQLANVPANLKAFLGTAPTEGAAGRLAAAFTKFGDVATPVFTAACVNQTSDNPTADAIGTDAASKVLATPAQKLVTDASGRVTVGSNADKTGYGLADDAITAAKFDESTAFPLKTADTGATAVARTGADSDTLETLSDQVDGITGGQTNNITVEATVVE